MWLARNGLPAKQPTSVAPCRRNQRRSHQTVAIAVAAMAWLSVVSVTNDQLARNVAYAFNHV